MKLSEFVGYFYYLWEAKSIWKKSKCFKQLFDALEIKSVSLMTVLNFFVKFFRSEYGRKWNSMQTSNNDLMYFSSFLKHDKHMNQKLIEF